MWAEFDLQMLDLEVEFEKRLDHLLENAQGDAGIVESLRQGPKELIKCMKDAVVCLKMV